MSSLRYAGAMLAASGFLVFAIGTIGLAGHEHFTCPRPGSNGFNECMNWHVYNVFSCWLIGLGLMLVGGLLSAPATIRELCK